MKRIYFLTAIVAMACAMSVTAQDEKSGTMREVTVRAARTVQKADGQWIFPTREQLESSANGYSLLAKLALPHIRVDEAMQSIAALTNLGGVQVRINDVEVSSADLLSLDMDGVQRIEFVDNPGLRYGDGVAYVINIKVKKAVGGYVLGTQLTNALTTANGSETVYGKMNRGRSEMAFNYGMDYRRFRGEEYDETATYRLESGDAIALHRQLLDRQDRSLGHNAQLTYSLSDSDFVFQSKLLGSFDLRPTTSDATMALNGDAYHSYSCSRIATPALDLYYHQDFRPHQSLTANVVGTYIKSSGTVENDEGTAYHYDTDGRTRSLWSEAIYDNRMKPFTLSTGFQLGQRYSHNRYNGNAEAVNNIHTSDLYLFSQLQGRVGKLGYMGGLGVSRRYYRQADNRQNFWLFRPKFTLAYSLTDHLKARYAFEVAQHVSQIAFVSDVSIKINQMETLVGNPEIHPARRTSHDLKLTYTRPRFTTELQGYWRLNAHCNMEKYSREDDRFYKTQTNTDNACNFFYIQSYNQWDILPSHLTATLYGSLYRFFNYGEDYTHTYTAFNGGCSLQAYLGRWTLGAYADNGWNFMEGEHRGHQAPAWYFTVTYRPTNTLSLSLFTQHPFSSHPLTNKTELLSRYITKNTVQRSRDFGNMFTLSLSYRLDRGRKYRDIQRSLSHIDRDTGILGK